MSEIYTIQLDGTRLNFSRRTVGVPESVLTARFNYSNLDKSLQLVCRMGDPDLLHCIVFKREGGNGGIFAMHDRDNLLFVAVAESSLAYAIAQGYFGELTANARYGVDVFENMENPDD